MQRPQARSPVRRLSALAGSVAPGTVLCAAVAAAALLGQRAIEAAFGHPYLEAVVLAILAGIAVRSRWQPGPATRPGIQFSATRVLEVAVMLLGASISLQALVASGPALVLAIVATVILALGGSFLVARALGLSWRIGVLIACGNAICGNSAIAAVAPVIGADGDDVAASIAFTAVLGVLVVLGLPLLIPLLGLTATQYGVLAGLTVYAVPQVLAATLPVGVASAQVGTLVKLVRVLMLGPIVVALSLLRGRLDRAEGRPRPGLARLVPWFITGFLLLAGLRSAGLVPAAAAAPLTALAKLLTIVAMAALGLGVDLRVLRRVGGRVTAAVTLSLVLLLAISLAVVRLLVPS
jgi:uncharacterized integral membrane protein (TIGR00698 family)